MNKAHMNFYRPVNALIILIFLLSHLIGCKKSVVDDTPVKIQPPKITNIKAEDIIVPIGTPEFKTTVYVLDEETSNNIISIDKNKIVFAKGTTLRGARLSSAFSAQEVKVGGILSSGVTNSFPTGLLGKVTYVQENSTGIEVTFDDASFLDVFSNINFSLEEKVEDGLTIEKPIKIGSGVVSNTLDLKGTAKFGYTFHFDLEIKNQALSKGVAKFILNRSTLLTASTKSELKGVKDDTLYTKRFQIVKWIKLPYIVFPLVINPTVRAIAHGEIGIEGSFEAQIYKSDDTYEYGVAYQPGTGLLEEIHQKEILQNEPKITSASIKGFVLVGLNFDLSVQFYRSSLLTLGGSVMPYGKLEAECKSNTNGITLTPSVGLLNKIYGGIAIFGFKKGLDFPVDLNKPLTPIPIDAVSICGNAVGTIDVYSAPYPYGAIGSFQGNYYKFVLKFNNKTPVTDTVHFITSVTFDYDTDKFYIDPHASEAKVIYGKKSYPCFVYYSGNLNNIGNVVTLGSGYNGGFSNLVVKVYCQYVPCSGKVDPPGASNGYFYTFKLGSFSFLPEKTAPEQLLQTIAMVPEK